MNRRAFTMVELLVVIGVLGVLLALLLPVLSLSRATADRARCAVNLRTLGQGMAAYASDHGVYPPSVWNVNNDSPPPGEWTQKQIRWFHLIAPYVRSRLTETFLSEKRLRPGVVTLEQLAPGSDPLRGCPVPAEPKCYGYNWRIGPDQITSVTTGPQGLLSGTFPKPGSISRPSERAFLGDSVGIWNVMFWPWWDRDEQPMPRKPHPIAFSLDFNRHPARPGRRVGPDEPSLNMLFADLSVRTVSAREAHYAATFQAYYSDRPGWRGGR